MLQLFHRLFQKRASAHLLMAYGLFLLVISLAGACNTNEAAEVTRRFTTSAVDYPQNYQIEFVHYATIERKDGTIREIFITPEALDGLKIRRPLPDHTTIVIEGHYAQRDATGELIYGADQRFVKAEPLPMVHVIEKRSSWRDNDFPSIVRSGQWNFGSFHYGTGEKFDEDLVACFNCHNTMAFDDFLYTTVQLSGFALDGDPEYFFCNLAGRIAC